MSSLAASSTLDRVQAIISRHMSKVNAQLVLRHALQKAGRSTSDVDSQGLDSKLLELLLQGLTFFLPQPQDRESCASALRSLQTERQRVILQPQTINITSENDVVTARSLAKSVTAALGFGYTEQIKAATVVSELARNIERYAGSGRIVLEPLTHPKKGLLIRAQDQGPGIAQIASVLDGTYRSKTGMGLGLLGCKKLLNEFSIDTGPGRGTHVLGTLYAEP